MRNLVALLVYFILIIVLQGCNAPGDKTLRVSTINSRYFADGTGKAVYLTGSHTWNTMVEMNSIQEPEFFDFDTYLDFLEKYHHNFLRLWTWEAFIYNQRPDWDENGRLHRTEPHPWLEVDGEMAPDGNPKLDLTKFNPAYFERLRQRVEACKERGIFVSVMLFEGWGEQSLPNGFAHHPFHPLNNINSLEIDTTVDAKALAKHELVYPRVLAIQEAYVSKVIETVNGFDNVLYEISNENHPASTDWQYHMINFIKEKEKTLPIQHPVGMTFQWSGGKNQALFDSPADWISPNKEGGYKESPQASDGKKVILNDTDHLWGLGGNHQWVWKSFMQGLNPIFMDPYDRKLFQPDGKPPISMDEMTLIRKNMGYTRRYAERMDLIHMVPDTTLTSTGYCLAKEGEMYLAYLPDGNSIEFDLTNAAEKFEVEWLDPLTGEAKAGIQITGGERVILPSPFTDEAVVYLKRQ
jgi:hypothetical protein